MPNLSARRCRCAAMRQAHESAQRQRLDWMPTRPTAQLYQRTMDAAAGNRMWIKLLSCSALTIRTSPFRRLSRPAFGAHVACWPHRIISLLRSSSVALGAERTPASTALLPTKFDEYTALGARAHAFD
jgi:hypothetical protein